MPASEGGIPVSKKESRVEKITVAEMQKFTCADYRRRALTEVGHKNK